MSRTSFCVTGHFANRVFAAQHFQVIYTGQRYAKKLSHTGVIAPQCIILGVDEYPYNVQQMIMLIIIIILPVQ